MAKPSLTSQEADHLAVLAARCRHDPLLWAETAWDWGRGDLTGKDIRVWQSEIMDDIAAHVSDPETRYQPLKIAVASGHGIGKMLTLQTLVPTPSGVRRWGDLQVGEYVFGADGAPTRIVGIPYKGTRPCYRVTFDDGSYADVGQEHEWDVRGRQERRNNTDTWRTLETQEIAALGVKRHNGKAMARQWEIPAQGAAQFPHRDQLPLHPYVMGVWISDGNGSTITKASPAVREKLDACHVAGTRHGEKDVRLKSFGAAERRADPVFACRSWEKYIPDVYKYASVEQRTALFEGLMDGDGEVHGSGSCGYSSSSERLLDDVIWLARSLGYKAMKQPTVKRPTYTHNGQKLQGRLAYRATINTPDNPFTHEERRAAWKPSEARYLTRWIDSVEPIGEMDGMCITVEADDHLYLTNDFIVTHNSATMGMVSNWAMSCWAGARVVITANTEGQLRTKTSPEIAKWFSTSISAPLFDIDTLSIKARQATRETAWAMDFTPWSEHNTEAFAGLHNEGRIIVLMMDEASGIPAKIWEVAEGALTDENTVLIWIAFGNPTSNTGEFRECFRRNRNEWITKQIDSRTVEGTNTQYLQQIVDKYGEDSDRVKVRVRGMFPSASTRQLIPTHLIDAARGKHLPKHAYDFAPVILTCDPAWTGDDDLIIAKRQGLTFEVLDSIARNDNDTEIALKLARYEDKYEADAVFIDLGYGTGIASAGRTWGRSWELVNFASRSPEPGYANIRAYMWDSIATWLEEGGALDPDDDVLYEDLISVETKPTSNGEILLKSKEDMKKDGLPSPNRGDALALSFARPVSKKRAAEDTPYRSVMHQKSRYIDQRGEYDPHA